MAQLDFLISSFGLKQVKVLREETLFSDTPSMYSMLGTPVYGALEIKPGSYRDFDGATVTYPGMQIAGVLLMPAMQKNIVKTPVNGNNGTFKEYISDGDFSISIQGMFASPYANVYPQAEMADFTQILKAPVALQIVNRTLNNLGIYQLVIEYYELPQRAGHYNTQLFVLQCTSDEPFELQLK